MANPIKNYIIISLNDNGDYGEVVETVNANNSKEAMEKAVLIFDPDGNGTYGVLNIENAEIFDVELKTFCTPRKSLKTTTSKKAK